MHECWSKKSVQKKDGFAIISFIKCKFEFYISKLKLVMSSQKRLFLLDAYALIFRGYYAFIKNPRINSKGMDTSAIMGFMNS